MTVVNTGLPVISGSPVTNHVLTTTDGQWTHDTPDTVLVAGRQWLRCDAAGDNCVAIAGANGQSYGPVAADVGSTIRSQITMTEVASPPPDPFPDPPPPGAFTLDSLADINFTFVPDYVSPAAFGGTGGGGMTYQSTPYGDGFKFISTASMPALWDAANGTFTKVCLAQGHPSHFWGELNATEHWEFNMYFPSPQSIPDITHWHSGELWQWHTSQASGHHIALNPSGTFRIGRLSSVTGYQFTNGPSIIFNTWMGWVIDVKWKQDSTGYIRVYLNGVKLVDFSGQTDFNDGNRRLQFGWYADRQYTNEVRFGGISVTRT